MAIVGTAYVEVKAVTNKIRGEIRDGFQRGMSGVGEDTAQQFEQEMLPGMDHAADEATTSLKRKFTKAGDTSAGSFLERFRLRTWNGMESLSNKFLGLWGASGNDSGNRFGQKFWGSAQKFFGKVSLKPILFGGLAAFIPDLVALVGQLSGGLFSLASSIGQAAGAVPVLYSSLVPLMSVLGGVKLAFSGVGAALKVLNNPDATPKATAEALNKLTPAARGFAEELHRLQPEVKSLKETAGKNLFPGLTAGLKGAEPLLGPFRRMVGQIDKAVGNAAKSTGRWLGGPNGLNMMRGIFQRNVTSVHNLTGAFTPLARSFLRTYSAMQPVQNEFTQMIKNGAKWLDLWTGSHQATMENYFQRSFDRLRQVGRIIMDLVRTVLNAGHTASQAGNSMLDSIEKVTAGWAKLTGQIGTQNRMRDYFNQTVPVMHEVAGMLGDIVKGIIHLGSSDQNLLPLLRQIRENLFPAIGQLMHAATGPLATDMVNLLTDVTRVLAQLSSGGGLGFLTSFANALDQVAKAVSAVLGIPGVGRLAGYLLGIAGAVAAYGKVISIIKGFSLIKWVTGLGTAAKTTTVEMDALAASEERAAMAGGAAGRGGGLLGGFRGKFGRAAGIFAGGQILGNMVGGRTGGYLSAIGTGAAAGSFFGPYGALAGGAVGGLNQFLSGSKGPPVPSGNTLKDIAMSRSGATAIQRMLAIPEGKEFNVKKTLAGLGLTTKQEQALANATNAQERAALKEAAAEKINQIAHEKVSRALTTQRGMTNQLTASLNNQAAQVLAISGTYDNFRSQLNGLRGEVTQNGAALKGFSDGAIANRQALSGAVQAVFDHINAMRQQGASAKQVQQALLDMSNRLRDQAKAAGLSGNAVDAFLAKVGLMPSKIRQALAGLRAMGLAAGGNLGRGFVLGIQKSQGAATSAAKVLADQTVKHMREDALQERSPSKVTEKIGKFFVDGFAGGIMAGQGRAKRAAEITAEVALHALYQTVDKIASGLAARRQSLAQAISVLGQTGQTTGVTSIRDAIRGGPHATDQEERAVRKMLHDQVQSMRSTLNSTLRSEDSRAATLRREIANSKSKKTQANYIQELGKIENQRKQVLDLRDQLNRREDKAQKYLAGLNDRLDRLATRRQAIADKLAKAQGKLASLRDAKAQIEDTIRGGITSFTDITATVPQGVAITASRVVSGIQGRLKVVQQWAADIKTLIKRGLNKTMIAEIINQGPDVGGQYARALVSATAAQISSLNQTQKQITGISNSLAAYVGSQFYDAGIKMAQGIVIALKKKQSDLDAAAAEMGRKMAKALKQALGIKSPSSVFRDEIGQYIPKGVAEGIDRATPHAVRAIHRMNHKLIAASQVAMSPSLASQAAGVVSPTSINGPLLSVEHLHIRDDSDIDKLEQMLYKAHSNVSRAAGKRVVVPTS